MKTTISKEEKQVWVIRPGTGNSGDSTGQFLDGNFVGLEDAQMGDLNELPCEREAFYQRYGQSHLGDTRTGITGIGGKYFRFVHEIAIGDTVLIPSRKDRNIYIGLVKSEYAYCQTEDSQFPHRRQVEWLYVFAKALLSEMAKRECGSARTLFKLSKNIREIRTLIQQKKAQPFILNERR